MNRKHSSTLFLIALCAASTSASAHIGAYSQGHTGFVAGFVHPLTGLDHLAVMVSVGLWSALAARRAGATLLWGPAGFAGMLLVGALLGWRGLQLPAVEPMIAASLVVTGLLVVSRLRLPGLAAALLMGAFALFHGLAHGDELAGGASALPALSGMLAATLLLHATGLALGGSLRSASAWLPRLAGAAVAVSGVALLAS